MSHHLVWIRGPPAATTTSQTSFSCCTHDAESRRLARECMRSLHVQGSLGGYFPKWMLSAPPCLPAGRDHEASIAARRVGGCNGRACTRRDDGWVLSHVSFVHITRPVTPAPCHHWRRGRSTVAFGLLLLQRTNANYRT